MVDEPPHGPYAGVFPAQGGPTNHSKATAAALGRNLVVPPPPPLGGSDAGSGD